MPPCASSKSPQRRDRLPRSSLPPSRLLLFDPRGGVTLDKSTNISRRVLSLWLAFRKASIRGGVRRLRVEHHGGSSEPFVSDATMAMSKACCKPCRIQERWAMCVDKPDCAYESAQSLPRSDRVESMGRQMGDTGRSAPSFSPQDMWSHRRDGSHLFRVRIALDRTRGTSRPWSRSCTQDDPEQLIALTPWVPVRPTAVQDSRPVQEFEGGS